MSNSATTTQERQVRIGTLVSDGNSEAVQGLMELAAHIVTGKGDGDTELSPAAHDLAEKISETFEPEVPCFEVGEEVTNAADAGVEPVVIGKVVERYLNERGDWEYQVRSQRYGTNTYGEQDIAPIRK